MFDDFRLMHSLCELHDLVLCKKLIKKICFFVWVSSFWMDLISIHDELLYIHLNGWYLKSKEFTMRKFITVINVMLMLTGKTVYAGDIDIVVTGTVTRSYSVNLTNKVTLGSGLSNCAMIGSVNSIDMGGTVATKNDGSGKVAYYTLIERSSSSAVEVCSGQYANYRIYKTSVDGIGISYNDADPSSESKGSPITPTALTKYIANVNTTNVHVWVDVRLWRYSAAADSLPFGLINIQGPAISQGVGASSAGDVIDHCSSLSTGTNPRLCLTDIIKYPLITTSVYSGTCEFVDASKIVQMGKRNIPANSAEGYGSPWVDASFQLRCPDAWGFYSNPSSPTTITRNSAVMVTVKPRDGVVNASKGIFKLDGSGAQGVGIQLAWGDYGSQGETPAKPVQLNTPTNASGISSNFAAGPYAKGSNAVSGDGTIKMAARYIRTTGTVQPGPANGLVEILANYQ
ncbi:fimbrial protein [Phytobacter diazotrophicus]|uniref:fimbrial protein n=1 Tax=Phytobacter diazotrophicus TaxID=395631 RepID=UPI002935A7CD|nr:fimbrial protein [Phytobacter diazotrophicus]MDV2900115.1 fimbrial protein [Phytobacter diazotrophicus]